MLLVLPLLLPKPSCCSHPRAHTSYLSRLNAIRIEYRDKFILLYSTYLCNLVLSLFFFFFKAISSISLFLLILSVLSFSSSSINKITLINSLFQSIMACRSFLEILNAVIVFLVSCFFVACVVLLRYERRQIDENSYY